VSGYEEKMLDGKRGKDALLKPRAVNYTVVDLTGGRQWLVRQVHPAAVRKPCVEKKKKSLLLCSKTLDSTAL
jgi:hypothetical protein